MVAGAGGREDGGVTGNRYRIFFLSVMNVLELDGDDGCATLFIY